MARREQGRGLGGAGFRPQKATLPRASILLRPLTLVFSIGGTGWPCGLVATVGLVGK